jgi:MoaA/NifB/PqqE/SkfB family radical SAM enzyme
LPHEPVGDAIALLDRLLEWIEERPTKRELLGHLDSLRDDLHGVFMDAYADDYYAKLLTLKLTNYVVSKYHLLSRHSSLASAPVTLMVDPANSCQLQCPGCVHSANEQFTSKLLWPDGVMKVERFAELLKRYGPFAVNTVLYNYGEPLLNKQLPGFIRLARGYGMTTNFSTNLSLRFDTEEFVRAQPDHVVLSIDGISQETYGRFRKRGDLALVLENVRKLVEAKRAGGFNRPILVWRFFPFEHNVHEVDATIELAEQMGVDQLIIGSPFDVSNDDPGVRLTECDKQGRYEFTDPSELARRPESILEGIERADETERFFEEGWLARLSGEDLDEPARSAEESCTWLYFNLTADARGRVMPCCISPSTNKDLVYADLADGSGDWFESERFALSRLGFADREAFDARLAASGGASAPFCAQCPRRPALTYGPQTAISDISALDFKRALVDLGQESWRRFGAWGACPGVQKAKERGEEASPRSFAALFRE